MPKYILIYPAPPLIPADSDAIAEQVLDPDDATAIASGDVTTAKWIVENPDGDAVRMTTGDLIAQIQAGAGTVTVPTFAVRTAYHRLSLFVFDGVLYRVLQEIPANNAGDVSTLLATGQVQALGGSQSDPIAFRVLNWRGGKPRPPFKSDMAAFSQGLLTIGIDLDGVLWTLKDTPATDAEGVWIDFDTNEWQFEQNDVLPNSALQTGDYYYRYDDDVWVLYDGTQQTVYYDRDISAFLPNHIFLGQFSNAEAATQSIVGYDGTKTYLAYFTVTVSGRTGREVRQLQSYTPGATEGISWVSTDETLNHLSDELHKLIQANVNSIKVNAGNIGEEGVNVRNNARSIMDLETEQDQQDTRIQTNENNIPDAVSDRDAIRGVRTDGYLTPRQVRIDSKATFTKEASQDPELDTLHIRYAAIDYDATAYNADNLAFAQMMFNNATLASATRIKIGYINGRRIGDRLDTLVVGSRIQLLEVNTGPDYEEPNNVFEASVTGVSRTVKTGLEDISTIELSLDTSPTLSVGLGPNTQYFVAVSGRFEDRVVPVISSSDIGRTLTVAANGKLIFVETQRAEQIFFNANTTVGNSPQAVVHRTTDPIVTRFGSGAPNMIRTVSGETGQLQFARPGIFDVHFGGLIDVQGTGNSLRVLPRVIFTDTSDQYVGEVDDHYHRVTNGTSDNHQISGEGILIIPSANFIVNMQIVQEITGGGTTFSTQADWSLTISID